MNPAALAAFVIGYSVGSIDFAVWVGRARGVDIYRTGSGNPGAANVLRNLGWRAALPVMMGDLGKGLLGALAGTAIGGTEVAGWAAGFAAVAGHCFPVWHRFRGGKGVATSFGAMIWMEPWLGLAAIAVWALLLAATRISSIGSLVAVVGAVPGAVLAGVPGPAVWWAGAMAALVVARHHGNIRDLVAGRERSVRPGGS